MNDFPANATISKEGSVSVRYFADNSTSIFLSGSRKIERKSRYVELVSAAGRYYLLVYKQKKNTTVPYFKIEILPDTIVKLNDRYSEFRFYLDNEETAIFDMDDSAARNDWVDAINVTIDALNGRAASPPRGRNPSPARALSRSLSPGLRRSASAERSRSPIVYARSGSTQDTEQNRTAPIPTASSLAPRSRTALSTATLGSETDGHIGLGEPVRRIQRHLDSPVPLGTVTKSSPDRDHGLREQDGDVDHSLALGSSVKSNLFDSSRADMTPFRVNSGVGCPVSPISSMSRTERSHPSLSSNLRREGVGALSAAAGNSNTAMIETVIGGDVASPPRAPGMRVSQGAQSNVAQSPSAPVSAANTADTESHAVRMVLPADADVTAPNSAPAQEIAMSNSGDKTALLVQENQSISAMNEELNEALVRTESLLRSTEEDHMYQIAHMQHMLERAQAEPAQLKAELAELQEEKDSLAQSFKDQSHELELNRSEIRDLKDELLVSQKINLGLQDTIAEYEVKYSARNVDRISQLEAALTATHGVLAERDAEVEELTNQLDAFRSMIREKEVELRTDPHVAKSAELSARRMEMQREIDELRHQLGKQDEDFVSGFGGAMESQIKAKMVPLNQSTRKLSMDLAAAHAAEEAQRVSKVRLESLVAQQEGYIEQLNQQVAGLRSELSRAGDLAQELAVYKDDARSAALQREHAHKERDELSRRVTSLEREITTQREAFLVQLEVAQAEIFKQKAHVSKVGIEDSHMHTEIAILNRRIELGKEQYIQLETQLHEAQRQIAMEGQHSAKKKESFQEALETANQTVRELQSQCKSMEEMLSAEQLDARRRQQEHDDVTAALKRAHKEALTRGGALEEKVHKLELALTSERVATTHLKEINENLEIKLQTTTDKLNEASEELESAAARNQKHIADIRQQLKESEAQRRALSERDGSTHRELLATLKAAEDTNRLLREDLASIALERQSESKAMSERLAAQLTLQEKVERKHQELERLLSSSESEKRIAEQHHAKREAELVTTITEITTEKDALEVYVHKEKGEVARVQRALEDAQADLRSKTQFHEKLTRLHSEQVQVSASLSEEIQQLKRTHAEALRAQGVEVDQLQLKLRSLQAAQSEASQVLQDRCQSLEDSLISTAQELKRANQHLEETRAQLLESREGTTALTATLAEAHTEAQVLTDKLQAQAKESAALTQRLAACDHTITTQQQSIADMTDQVASWEAADNTRSKELTTTKALLQDSEDQLRDVLRKLENAENEIHYLQDIAIPDLNSSALDTVERSKSEQSRYASELEALHRSLEHREKALKDLHARIHHMEEVEVSLNHTNASLQLKLGEMMPIKEHSARLEAQRQATATEISELAATKHAALTERDEAMNRVTSVVQDCRREAYALRRVASNMAIHADAEIGKRELTRGPFQSSFTGKPAADIFSSAEESGTELREMVGLVTACSESMLRDFVALRTSCVHQWFTLQSELLKSPSGASDASAASAPASGTLNGVGVMANIGSPLRSPLSPTQKTGSPYQFGGDVAHTIPTVSLNELLQQTESMLTKLVNREKTSVSKLSRQLEEEQGRKAQSEARLMDLQQRIDNLDAQLLASQSSKHSTDQRSAAETQALQQRIGQLTADLNRRQDEYSEMIASLTKSHEELSTRQSAHLASVMEQRISEANIKAKSRVEVVEQRLRTTETALHGELDELRRDYNRQVELCQRLERDFAQRDSEAATAFARFDSVQAELEDKTYQLENTLSQLEKAELKAAKEARQRLELERTMRRFKNPSVPGSGSSVHESADAASEVDNTRQRPPSLVGTRFASSRSLQGGTGAGTGASASRASMSARERVGHDTSYDNASVNSASYTAEEYDEARDLPSPLAARNSANSTPLVRSALLRGGGGTPDNQSRRFFPSSTNTANSSIASMNLIEPRSASRSYTAGSGYANTTAHGGASAGASRSNNSALEYQEMGERVHVQSASNATRTGGYNSSPDNSPEPVSTSNNSVWNLNRSLESAAPGANNSASAFDRAFQATSRIEQAMKAKGWKLNK